MRRQQHKKKQVVLNFMVKQRKGIQETKKNQIEHKHILRRTQTSVRRMLKRKIFQEDQVVNQLESKIKLEQQRDKLLIQKERLSMHGRKQQQVHWEERKKRGNHRKHRMLVQGQRECYKGKYMRSMFLEVQKMYPTKCVIDIQIQLKLNNDFTKGSCSRSTSVLQGCIST